MTMRLPLKGVTVWSDRGRPPQAEPVACVQVPCALAPAAAAAASTTAGSTNIFAGELESEEWRVSLENEPEMQRQ